MNKPQENDKRMRETAVFAAGLRAAATFYEQHPEIPPPSDNFVLSNGRVDSKEEAAAVMRALGSCAKEFRDEFFKITKQLDGVRLEFIFYRHNVCVRKVVGTKEIPEEIIPARTEEIVEWECEPILAESNVAEAA